MHNQAQNRIPIYFITKENTVIFTVFSEMLHIRVAEKERLLPYVQYRNLAHSHVKFFVFY